MVSGVTFYSYKILHHRKVFREVYAFGFLSNMARLFFASLTYKRDREKSGLFKN